VIAWGITVEGRPVLLAIEPGSTESTDAWREFERSVIARRLRPPTLVISEGGPGLIGAVELVRPASARQRCVIHRCRNVLAKVPTHAQDQLNADFWAIWDIDVEAGGDAVAEARRRVKAFEAKWAELYPSAVACLTDDLDHLVVYLRFPKAHWNRIRHSNFIARTFAETRRRVEVISRLPAKRSCPSLVPAVSDRASRDWRDVEMTPKTVRHLQQLRLQLLGPPPRPDTPDRAVDQPVTTAA
jgi:transposase-like protein